MYLEGHVWQRLMGSPCLSLQDSGEWMEKACSMWEYTWIKWRLESDHAGKGKADSLRKLL